MIPSTFNSSRSCGAALAHADFRSICVIGGRPSAWRWTQKLWIAGSTAAVGAVSGDLVLSGVFRFPKGGVGDDRRANRFGDLLLAPVRRPRKVFKCLHRRDRFVKP